MSPIVERLSQISEEAVIRQRQSKGDPKIECNQDDTQESQNDPTKKQLETGHAKLTKSSARQPWRFLGDFAFSEDSDVMFWQYFLDIC